MSLVLSVVGGIAVVLIVFVLLIPHCVYCGSLRTEISEIVETIGDQRPGVWRTCKSCGKRWYK